MSIQIIVDWVILLGCTFFIFIPLEKKRIRARWANLVFVCSGLVGVAKGIICLFLDMNWISVSHKNFYLIDTTLRLVFDGFLLGVIFTLMFSGQLRGAKRFDEQIKHESAV
jgi:hypothetical protein